MADACRYERQNAPNIQEQEYQEGSGFRDEINLRNNSTWKSSPTPPSQGDVSQVRTSVSEVTTEDDDKREIIVLTETETSIQKIAFVPPRQDDNVTNMLGKIQHEGYSLVTVSPACTTSISGVSGSKTSRVTGTEADDNSSEVISRLSRIDSAKQDMKNLKSATLGRMGKMFKLRPPTPAGNEKDTLATAEEQYGRNPTRKEKTHSLGRMLRLVDKDGAPRKLFSHTRTGSLTRLRKMHSTVGNATGSSEESRNIFTRMLNQFRGRSPNATDAEPNLQSINGPANSPKLSLGTRLMMSLSARGTSSTDPAIGVEKSVERVKVEYTA